MDKVLKRLDLLEKRVNELEKQLSIIKQMEHSERVQKYIDNVERARKVTSLLETMDNDSSESVNVVMDEKVSEELRNEFDLNSLEDAHSYLETTEMMLAEEEKYLDGIVEDKDWSEIFEYQKNADGIVIARYIGFDEEEIIIPDYVEGMLVIEIGKEAFKNCQNLKKIILPQYLRIIGKNAFSSSALEEIELPKTLVKIESSAFSLTNIREIELPQSVKVIEPYTFYHCVRLQKIVFPKKLLKIGDKALAECKSLKDLDIPNSCKEIGNGAFSCIGQNYGRLGNPTEIKIRLGDSIDFIGNDIFGCRVGIKEIIYCKSGSNAMRYAREHRISVRKYEEFEELD